MIFMKLNRLFEDTEKKLAYMERLVNDGSPSGFSAKYTSSVRTNPLAVSSYFIGSMHGGKISSYGQIPQFAKGNDFLYAHPDWQDSNERPDGIIVAPTNFLVSPTASVRTVKAINEDYYIKLSYPGYIGRFERNLDDYHISASLEANDILHTLEGNKNMDRRFAFFPENGASLLKYGIFKTGCVFRDAQPIGHNASNIKYIIPGFSLFGKDKGSPNDTPLLQQILKKTKNPEDYLLRQIILPLIDIYFGCVFEEGILPEMHAQNVLFGFDENNDVKSIILRDMESVNRDKTIRKKLGKNFTTPIYELDAETQKIRHSFFYDHKLGEYLAEPIINCAAKAGLVNKTDIIHTIKQYVQKRYGGAIKKHFPSDGLGYKHDKSDMKPWCKPYVTFGKTILR